MNTGEGTPQYILFQRLREEHPEVKIEWERKHLIPGRKYQTDLFIPPKLVIEVDGFKYHRSKKTFQLDRVRQNTFCENGYLVLRYYTKQIFDPDSLSKVVSQIVRVNSTRNLPE